MRPRSLDRYVLGQVEPIQRSSISVTERLVREQDMIIDFAALADRAGNPLPGDSPELRNEAGEPPDPVDFPPVRYRGLFALAQHYGVPTRFVDWTWRPLVAAYFACAEAAEAHKPYKARNNRPKSERCAIWALSRQGLARLAADWDPTICIVTAPAALVPNLAAQGGCFTLVHYRTAHQAHEDDPPDLDQLIQGKILPDEEPTRWARILYKFTFPASEAGRLLYLLSFLDITAASVFPGLAGVERSMFERALMPRPAFRDDPNNG